MKLARALVVACSLLTPAIAGAQLVPSDRWYTIETHHFRVHFIKALEPEGRRAAVNAERAWADLSTELKAPKSKVDLVIADNVDYVNGYASTFPTNRIVVYAHPPADALDLRPYDDWLRLVITHELTHIFHLDRADGLWRLGRDIFGRHPALFPNQYQPSWLIEGLAVYYESRITGTGRLEGSEHYMIARSAAEVNRVPLVGEWSSSTSRYPGGESVYAYGSLLLDYMSRTRGPDKIPKFVDETSRIIWPLSLNRRAKRAFGISFENAFRDWRDSMVKASEASAPVPGWRDLTHDGRFAGYPRWLGDTAVIYAAANGKQVTSAYSVTLDGKIRRIGRRNSLDANVPQADGTIVFSQPDYIDAFHYRNDLYVQRGDDQIRLTRGARLTQPDARPDGYIVAVQDVPGTTILVGVSSDGSAITRMTQPSLDVQWAEPRWSPDGSHVAAIRLHGGVSELVLLDEEKGYHERVLVSERATISSPSWSASGERIFYASNRTGVPQGYAASLAGDDHERLTSTSTGFFSPELSPDSKLIAGLDFRFDGYHVGFGAAPAPAQFDATAAVIGPRAGCADCRAAMNVVPPLALEDVPRTKNYSPWATLLPHYWEPIVTQSTGSGTSIGAATSGYDVIGRHSYYAQATFNTKYDETEGYAAYQYAGFGQPYLNFDVSQEWEHFGVFTNAGVHVGDLARRAQIGGASVSFSRPRVRTFASLALGAELESRSYSTSPDTLISHLSDLFSDTHRYPSVFASASWSNTRRAALSISREDGVSLSATVRDRWETGGFSDASKSVVGVAAMYKSLDLPGFAHHVIALRGAAGYADDRSITNFSVGGLSGGSLDIGNGLSVGGGGRTFGVRGFPPSAEQGIRALGGTAEYRAPIAVPSKRVPFIPVLFDKISIAAFGEAGRAFCPSSAGETEACRFGSGPAPWLASTGAEIDFDTAIQYDVPARFRLGVAVPVLNRSAGRADAASVYLTVGSSF